MIVDLLQPIFDNFLKFDFLIVVLAGITSYVYYLCLKSCQKLYQVLMPKGHLMGGQMTLESINKHFSFYLKSDGEMEILEQRQKTNQYYVLFLNMTAIFPLMGLLGTVISLIPMVGSLDTNLFFVALTSTFWGIVFAIIFKLCNGYLQAKVEENNELVNTYLLRHDSLIAQMKSKGYVHE